MKPHSLSCSFNSIPMSFQRRRNLVGELTKHEVLKSVPVGTFPYNLKMHWDRFLDLVEAQPEHIRHSITTAAVKKKAEKKKKRSIARLRRIRNAISNEETDLRELSGELQINCMFVDESNLR